MALVERIAGADRQYQSALSAVAPQPFKTSALRAVADRLAALQREDGDLALVLEKISAALDRSPGIELDRLDWRLSHDEARPDAGLLVDLHASLPQIRGDDTTALAAAVARFAATLRDTTDAPVETLQWPAAIDAQRALSADDVAQISRDIPHFQVRLATLVQR